MHRINRKAFAPLSTKRKIGLVLAVWMISAGVLYSLNRNPVSRAGIDLENTLRSVSIEKNHMGRCRFGLSDPADKHPLGTVSFESLQTAGADTGPFKTAALREMEITQLKIDLLSSPAAPVSSTTDTPAGQSTAANYRQWSQILMQTYFQSLDKQELLQVALPDFSHLIHIRVSDFQCRFLEGQNIGLHIQSKKASVQADNDAGILLRGHVILRTPEATLESNTLLWDIQNQTFRVQGFYSIRTGDQLEKGVDGYFNQKLQKLTTQKTFANKGEKTK